MRSISSIVVDEEEAVRLGGDEAQLMQMCGKALEPCMWRLLEPVKRLAQKAHIIRTRWIDKASRLLTVHRLNNVTVEKGIFVVQLVDMLIPCGCKVEDSADGGQLDDGR